MTEYQIITLKETHEKMLVSTTEYPLTYTGIFYIKFIEYEEVIDPEDGVSFRRPINFVTLLPDLILKRENVWSIEEEDEIVAKAHEARDQEVTMAEYRAAAEEEMARRAEMLPPHVPSMLDDEEEELINSDFKTVSDPADPNYG